MEREGNRGGKRIREIERKRKVNRKLLMVMSFYSVTL